MRIYHSRSRSPLQQSEESPRIDARPHLSLQIFTALRQPAVIVTSIRTGRCHRYLDCRFLNLRILITYSHCFLKPPARREQGKRKRGGEGIKFLNRRGGGGTIATGVSVRHAPIDVTISKLWRQKNNDVKKSIKNVSFP